MKTTHPRIVTVAASLLLAACVQQTPPPVQAPAPPAATSPRPATRKTPPPAKPARPAATVPGKITSIDISRLFTMVQTGNVYLIDTRPPLFFRLGHIGGANSLPLIKYDKALAAQRAQIDAAAKSGKLIVTYCQNTNCPDAHRMAKKLALLGHNVTVYHGGWEEWKNSGLE